MTDRNRIAAKFTIWAVLTLLYLLIAVVVTAAAGLACVFALMVYLVFSEGVSSSVPFWYVVITALCGTIIWLVIRTGIRAEQYLEEGND